MTSEAHKRYMRSEKGKAAHKRYRQKQNTKALYKARAEARKAN